MSTVVIGTNRFQDCSTLIAHRGLPVIQIGANDAGLVLDVDMPAGTTRLRIEKNRVTEGQADIVCGERLLSVIREQTLILHAVRLQADEVLVDLDLRPLGAAIYTDPSGLHIGGSTLAGNVVQGAQVAITIS